MKPFEKLVNNYQAVLNAGTIKPAVLYRSLLVGAITGVVVDAYRVLLLQAEDWALGIYRIAGESPLGILLLFAGLLVTGYGVGLLVTRFPAISGSGIPQVMGQLRGYLRHPWLSTLIAKFTGGFLCLFAGLSLGREGPSIQLGACVAQGLGNQLGASRTERRILIAGGASAGLAAAFNAPLAGAIFALEEIYKYFSPAILVSTMVSAVTADFITKIFFGMKPVLYFDLPGVIPLSEYIWVILLGILLGFAGAFYNWFLLLTQKLFRKPAFLSQRYRIMIPFGIAGIVGLTFPLGLGSGHRMTEFLVPSAGLTFLLLILAVKFFFSMVSFGSGAPGGIFFPLLILGAILGTLYGKFMLGVVGADADFFENWIVLAMAGYFAAIVRAPVTGMILLVEMTGSLNQLLPLSVVALTAYITASILKSKPVYDSLLQGILKDLDTPHDENDDSRKITVETIVHHGAMAEGKRVRELELPESCLLISVRRQDKDILPRGDTKIMAQDFLVVITSMREEVRVRESLDRLTQAE